MKRNMRQDIEYILRKNFPRELTIREIEHELKNKNTITHHKLDLYRPIYCCLNHDSDLAPKVDKSTNSVFPSNI
jgi:hypothetical protein